MGDYDRYVLPELCEIVEADRPADMRSQADGWALIAQLLDDQLAQVTTARTRLRRAWSSASAVDMSTLDDLATALTDAAEVARSNQMAWYGIAHYAEYAKDQLANLSRHWADAKKTLEPSTDGRYVPEGVQVQLSDTPDEDRMRVSYDEAAREVMDLVAEHTTQLAESLRELPTYVPPVSDGVDMLPIPGQSGDGAAGGPVAGDPQTGKPEDPQLQQGPGGMAPVPAGMGGYGGMGGMGGMGPGAAPILAGPTGGPMARMGPVPSAAPIASGGYTSQVLGSPSTPPPPPLRQTTYITRAPSGAVVQRDSSALQRQRRPVRVPVEYDVARLRRRTDDAAYAEDDAWKNPPKTSPGIISGVNEPRH